MTRSSTSHSAPGDGGEVFREAFDVGILPRVDAFSPDLIIVSAGFDAHRRDPLGGLQLREEDFAWVTRKTAGDRTAALRATLGIAARGRL